jgi:hypothetical protein
MRKFTMVLAGLAALALAACGNEPVEMSPGTGNLTVTAQALTAGMVDRVEVDVIQAPTGPGSSEMIVRTYNLGYNGKAWSSTFNGIEAGCYKLEARAYKNGVIVFQTANSVDVCVFENETANAELIILNQEPQDGLRVPVLEWITTSATTVRPGGEVTIGVGFSNGNSELGIIPVDDRGGSFRSASVNVNADGTGVASIVWVARDDMDTLPEPHAPLILELTDNHVHVQFQVFIRVLWDPKSITGRFRLNLAPTISEILVSPANPVSEEAGLLFGWVRLDIRAEDPDPCDSSESTCGRPEITWLIPENCRNVFLWWDNEDPVVYRQVFPKGAGSFDADPVILKYAWTPEAVCTLEVTVTDGEGAKISTDVVLRPFDLITLYTPSVEIDYQHGFNAVEGYGLEFGVFSNVRADFVDFIEIIDFWVHNPKITWSVGGVNFGEGSGANTVREGPYIARYSWLDWVVGENEVDCNIDGDRVWVEVVAKVCNPMLPDDLPDTLPGPIAESLCSYTRFEVEVPVLGADGLDTNRAAVCNNIL